ncbi:MAG: CRISPR-associated endoribonuclease Cas2 [Bryobacteraceae bacterium]|nr:CRISPR-associated endoribonuclease Cas2 [Bryobacteraceae bacterium]
MPRKNRYTGILKPLPAGKGSPEVSLVLVYDIEDGRIRARVSEICLDYGLERIQFSAFFGKLNRNRRQELALRLAGQIGAESARVRIFPICEQDLRDMWSLEQYRRDAGQLKAVEETSPPTPRLHIVTRDPA